MKDRPTGDKGGAGWKPWNKLCYSCPDPAPHSPIPVPSRPLPCIDLTERAVFRVTGNDRVRWLNGQVSANVARLDDTAALEACVCNLKGKLDGVVQVTANVGGENLVIDAPVTLRDSLFARLARYIISEDCEIEDITGEWSLLHCLGERPGLPGAVWRASNRFGPAGHDLWVAAASRDAVSAAEGLLPAEAIEEIRVRHGVPAWGAELSPDILPAEAGLDRRAIDFHKGCYLGQEVISRIESVGRVNRRLCLLAGPANRAANDFRPEAGAAIFPAESGTGAGEKPAGTVTSVVFSPAKAAFWRSRMWAATWPNRKRSLSPPGQTVS